MTGLLAFILLGEVCYFASFSVTNTTTSQILIKRGSCWPTVQEVQKLMGCIKKWPFTDMVCRQWQVLYVKM